VSRSTISRHLTAAGLVTPEPKKRPKSSYISRATPATLYDSMPKALPRPATDPDTHERIRHDRVDNAGSVTLRHNSRLHHIGIGRTHARTHVILLI
jgi:hypothetical protein